MLGKTAGGLYWMFRYLERFENTARAIETGQRIALTRVGSDDGEWTSILSAAGLLDGYAAKYETVTSEDAIDWMLRDPANPSSVLSNIETARQNARLVRIALTNEVWESVNRCWIAARDLLAKRVAERDLPRVLTQIRQRSAYVRGTMTGTMLRNEYYDFSRIGTFVERADNTARILDVKYYVLLPTAMAVASRLDNVQWESILRSLGAEGGYRMIYGNTVTAANIVQFLILDGRMPRSLTFCTGKVHGNLNYLAQAYGKRMPCHAKADELRQRFMSHDINAIFEYGLHEYIQDVVALLGDLGRQIEIDYRFNE